MTKQQLKHFLRKPETAAMFFRVPRQTHSRLLLLVCIRETERRFGMQTGTIPLVVIVPFPPVLFLPFQQCASFFCTKTPMPREVKLVKEYV